MANFTASNNMFFPTGLQGFFNLQQQIMAAQNDNSMMYPFFPTGWQNMQAPTSSTHSQPHASSAFQQQQEETSFNQMSIIEEEQSVTEPSPDVNLSSQQHHSIHEESQHSTHQNWNEPQQSEEVVQCNSTVEVTNTEVQEVCTDFSQPNPLPLENPKDDDQSNICTSPDMLYQFWSMKPDHPPVEAKEQLPRLSPDELQNILVRNGNTNILSPVHDNRAQFSEAPFLLNEFQQNTQESEMEENPMEVENDEESEYPRCLSNTDEMQADKMSEIMKNEEEWSKIDFVKEQKIQQGYEVETETADETTENESVYDQQSPSARGGPEACYYVNNNNFEENSPVDADSTNMTSIERNFLAILQAQQRK